MDVARPHSFLSSRVHIDVLSTLARTTQPLTGREIARRAGRSQERVRQVLEQLVVHGVVERAPAGSALLYTLNREHLAADAIEHLTGLRGALVERLHAALEAWRIRPVTAVMFGSAARGDGDVTSDIDLLLIRPASIDEEDAAWRDQLDGLATQVHTWTGNHASVLEIGEDELDDLVRRSPPVKQDLRADSFHLAGRRITSLLGAVA